MCVCGFGNVTDEFKLQNKSMFCHFIFSSGGFILFTGTIISYNEKQKSDLNQQSPYCKYYEINTF